MSQVSPVVEEVAVDGEVDLDMDGVEEVDLNMEKVKVEEAADSDVVAMEVLVVAVEEESITIATTKIKVRITIMELIHQILQGNFHLNKSQILFKLMYETIFVLNEGQSVGGSIIMMMVISQQE